jgi:hypothetical protein
MTILFPLRGFFAKASRVTATATLRLQHPSLFYYNSQKNALFNIMASTRKKTTVTNTTTNVTTKVTKAAAAGTKRSASPEEEHKEKIVKKVKSSTTKKKTWEPFDPSLPNNMTFPAEFNIPAKPEGSIKIASYNVASLPACIKKGFNTYVDAEDADILCVQETKVNQPVSTAVNDKVYKYRYWSFGEKKGYGKMMEKI